MLFSHLIIHRLQETLKWRRLRRAQRKPNQLKRVGCPSKIQSAGKQSSRAGKERSPGVVSWNRRQHIYLALIHFACAGLWMSNKYARRAPNGEEREALGWGSCTVTRLDECASNSKHVAVMCLMGAGGGSSIQKMSNQRLHGSWTGVSSASILSTSVRLHNPQHCASSACSLNWILITILIMLPHGHKAKQTK